MNMNAVRSHYPPDTHFLEACDSIGLLYLNELCGWQNSYSTEIAEKLLPEMISVSYTHLDVYKRQKGIRAAYAIKHYAADAVIDENLRSRRVDEARVLACLLYTSRCV